MGRSSIRCKTTPGSLIYVWLESPKEERSRKIFEEIIVKKFLNLIKTINHRFKNFNEHQAQEMWIKLHQGKFIKRKSEKQPEEKRYIKYKGIKIKITADFLLEAIQVRKQWDNIFKVMKEKTNLLTQNSVSRETSVPEWRWNKDIFR